MISDKTRKILWASSGNKCAICKGELVVNTKTSNAWSVIGDECHIVSKQLQGPRYNHNLSTDELDSCKNLILLCRVHHKIIDDQQGVYTTDKLSKIKADHEKWVSEKLSKAPLRIRRIQQNITSFLVRLKTGKDVLNVISNAYSYAFNHDDLEDSTEAEIVGGFLQYAQDLGNCYNDIGISEKVRIGFDISKSIKKLEDAGFILFGGQEDSILEGGIAEPSPWRVAILQVVRKTNNQIIGK